MWKYERAERTGIDGRRPLPLYRYIKVGDLTTLYVKRVDPMARGVPRGRLP